MADFNRHGQALPRQRRRRPTAAGGPAPAPDERSEGGAGRSGRGRLRRGGPAASFGRVTASDRPDLADFQCNGALAAAKAAGRNPREIAERGRRAPDRTIRVWLSVEIAGPGFINLQRHRRGAGRARRRHRRRPARRAPATVADAAPGAGRLRRPERRQGDARRPPARLDHRRGDQAALPLPRRRGAGRRPLRRLGLPDGPADQRRARRGSGAGRRWSRGCEAARRATRRAAGAARRPSRWRTSTGSIRPPPPGRRPTPAYRDRARRATAELQAGRPGYRAALAALRQRHPRGAGARLPRARRRFRPLEGRERRRRPDRSRWSRT